MAVANSNAVLPTPAHPMANPGYGKRVAPDQAPRTADDFAHLPRREASIAAFIDRLPEGAAMDAKTLAKVLPDYGQQACRSALRYLREAGHLLVRPVVEATEAGKRWVTRTFFSRTARPASWWERLLRGDVPTVEQPEPEPVPAPERVPEEPRRSRAYRALASLGRVDPRLTLSAAECAELEPLAAQWLALDTTPEQLTAALTTGLPQPITRPAGLMRERLERKMPPVPARFARPYFPDHPGEGLPPDEVTRHVDTLRAAAGIARKGGAS